MIRKKLSLFEQLLNIIAKRAIIIINCMHIKLIKDINFNSEMNTINTKRKRNVFIDHHRNIFIISYAHYVFYV